MTPAEVKVLRESLGLSPRWLAERLGLKSDRHLRAIEAGEAPVSMRLIGVLHEMEAIAESLADSMLDTVLAKAGLTDLDDIEDLDEADWPTLEVPRLDQPGDEYPAAFYRAVAARVRWELGGNMWIEYVPEEARR